MTLHLFFNVLDPSDVQSGTMICHYVHKHAPSSKPHWALVDMRREDRRAYDMKILELKTDAKVRTLAATVRQARVDGADAAFASGREELRMQLRIQAGMRLANRLLQIERMENMVEQLRERYDREVAEAEADVEVRLQNLLEMTDNPAE